FFCFNPRNPWFIFPPRIPVGQSPPKYVRGTFGISSENALLYTRSAEESGTATLSISVRRWGLRCVQGMLGHSHIQMTERYVKFVPTHASGRVIEAQGLEDPRNC